MGWESETETLRRGETFTDRARETEKHRFNLGVRRGRRGCQIWDRDSGEEKKAQWERQREGESFREGKRWGHDRGNKE